MSLVSIVHCENYLEENIENAVYASFENLGGIKKYIKPGMNVYLKANLVIKRKPEEGSTTHPAMIRALCKAIASVGACAIVGDSPGGPYTANALRSFYKVCGMEDAIEGTGATLNYNTDVTTVENLGGSRLKSIEITKVLKDVDLVIGVPKLKTHSQMVYTGAVKNMFGAIPGEVKGEYHFRMNDYDDFANALIDIYLSVKPQLHFMDAIVGMDQYGPTAGRLRDIGLVIAAEDGFALDKTVLDITNTPPQVVPILKNAYCRGLLSENIEIVGESIESSMIHDFEYPGVSSLADLHFLENKYLQGLFKRMKPKPVFSKTICNGCRTCEKVCPPKVITMKDGKPKVDLNGCISCFCCQELCPLKAVSVKKSKIQAFLIKIMGKLLLSDTFVSRKLYNDSAQRCEKKKS